MDEVVLDIRDLQACYFTARGVVRAVDGVSFDLRQGETLGLVGESGCGKTATGLSILGLISSLHGRVVGGEILYHGTDILKLSSGELRALRGYRISMIFQDPQTSLNPVLRVGEQIMEPMKFHLGIRDAEAKERAIELMKQLGIPMPEKRLDEYPHQFSGGMKQRTMIAAALSCGPEVLIADEPTTALDVTTKAQILDIFRGFKQDRRMSILFITHDLAIIAEMADRIVVMYGGRLAEAGTVLDIFDSAQHPYTQGLLRCLPDISGDKQRLETIPGVIPSLIDPPDNCIFSPRCPHVMPICREKRPLEYLTGPGHRVVCYLYSQFPVFMHHAGMVAHAEP